MDIHGWICIYSALEDLRSLVLIIIHGPTDLKKVKPLIYADLCRHMPAYDKLVFCNWSGSIE